MMQRGYLVLAAVLLVIALSGCRWLVPASPGDSQGVPSPSQVAPSQVAPSQEPLDSQLPDSTPVVPRVSPSLEIPPPID